jgi:hypothetical protein
VIATGRRGLTARSGFAGRAEQQTYKPQTRDKHAAKKTAGDLKTRYRRVTGALTFARDYSKFIISRP